MKEWRTKEYFLGRGGAHRRAVYKCMGYTDSDLSRPKIAVVNSWGEVCPGHHHLNLVSENVKAGIWQSGGMPVEFGVISQCGTFTLGLDGIRYDLATRDLVSFDIETVVNIQLFDGMALIGTCDKIPPGMLLAAARLDIPSILVPGGVMAVGEHEGNRITLSDLDELVMGETLRREVSQREISEVEERACPTAGACPLMGTANTMQELAEAAGMALPHSSTTLANSSELLRVAKRSGVTIVDLVRNDVRPTQIMNEKSLRNMVKVLVALGGSTNAILHLLALAHELKLEDKINLEFIHKTSGETPCLVGVAPGGAYYVPDLHKAGGIPVLMKTMEDLLELDVPTVSMKSLKEILGEVQLDEKRDSADPVIHPLGDAISRDGGINVLYGNLAPRGAIFRQAVMFGKKLRHEGQAKVFNSQEEALSGLKSGKISKGNVIVVRYEGPRGGPGMPDIYAVLAMVVGMGMEKDVAVITDGRFSGFARGFGICQISPEAARGGPLAVLRDGDLVTIDVEKRSIDALTDQEIKERLRSWKSAKKRERAGILGLYAKYAGPAYRGARLE